MSGFISSSPFQKTKHFLQIQSLAPGIARRSSGRFQLRRQLRQAITPNPCIVCGIRGYHCIRLVEGFLAARSVRRLDPRISGNRRISSWLRRGSSSPVRTSIVVPRVSSFLRFPVRVGPPSLSPHLPLRRCPSPSVSPPRRRPFPPLPRPCVPLRRRWPRPSCPVRPRPPPATPTRPPLRSPLLFPSSLFHGWEEKMRGRRR
jgi:hypothetical protein